MKINRDEHKSFSGRLPRLERDVQYQGLTARCIGLYTRKARWNERLQENLVFRRLRFVVLGGANHGSIFDWDIAKGNDDNPNMEGMNKMIARAVTHLADAAGFEGEIDDSDDMLKKIIKNCGAMFSFDIKPYTSEKNGKTYVNHYPIKCRNRQPGSGDEKARREEAVKAAKEDWAGYVKWMKEGGDTGLTREEWVEQQASGGDEPQKQAPARGQSSAPQSSSSDSGVGDYDDIPF